MEIIYKEKAIKKLHLPNFFVHAPQEADVYPHPRKAFD